MSMSKEYGGCRSRACMEGVRTRRRNYVCRKCGTKFQIDLLRPLPPGAEYCPDCRQDPEIKVGVDNAYQRRG